MKRSVPPRDRMAVLRAIHDEHRAALKALAFRREIERTAMRDRHGLERRVAREAKQRQAAEARLRDGPR